ncbi:MAG: hypothetical protein M3076_10480 [Actinomycetota bacterium]|nr:hypothetical protein [Actinomycetota bacterium]
MFAGSRLLLVGMLSVALAGLVLVGIAGQGAAAGRHHSRHRVAETGRGGSASGLGQLSGLLPRNKLTLESALQVNLSNDTVRLPIYPGTAPVRGQPGQTERVWYILEDASDSGLAHDLGVNYAPKLANVGIGCAACVRTVTEDHPSPQANPFGPAVIHFQGAPDFSPTRIAVPGPTGFPLKSFQAGAVAGPGYSPFIRIAGSDVVYNAPIIATGNGPFDVTHHTNTGDRVLRIHIAGPSAPGQFAESWADLLFVKGFDAGQPIVYLSTDAGQPLTAVLERATYVPALNDASFNGGDDFLGSSRERLFGFINGQTGAENPQAQGFQHLALDGHVGEDASLANTGLINALRHGGDLLNVFGDFPTLADPRHADAYSPLWDAQLGLWTPKAVKDGLNTRQIDEVQVFNLAATRPDLLTGVNPATGQPEPYGSVGVDINCAVIGYTAQAPTANLANPAPGSQFPPR